MAHNIWSKKAVSSERYILITWAKFLKKEGKMDITE